MRRPIPLVGRYNASKWLPPTESTNWVGRWRTNKIRTIKPHPRRKMINNGRDRSNVHFGRLVCCRIMRCTNKKRLLLWRPTPGPTLRVAPCNFGPGVCACATGRHNVYYIKNIFVYTTFKRSFLFMKNYVRRAIFDSHRTLNQCTFVAFIY